MKMRLAHIAVSGIFFLMSFSFAPGASAVELSPANIGSAIFNTITVNSTKDSITTGDGKCSLREALLNSNYNSKTYSDCAAGSSSKRDKIVLPAGTYCLTRSGADENNAVSGDLDIRGNLTIVGDSASSTIIDAGGDSSSRSRGCTTDILQRVFHLYGNSGAISVAISNVTITGGTAGSGSDGGGIYSQSGSLSLSDVTLTGNQAEDTGGALYILAADKLTIAKSTFKNNSADSSGGAIYASQVTETSITASTFSDNLGRGDGGGLRIYDGTLTLKNSTFSENTSLGTGGALYAKDTAVSIVNSTVTGNTASDNGGGIYAWVKTLNVASTTIYDNTSHDNGGGLYVYNNDAVIGIYDTILAGNTATTSGTDAWCWGRVTFAGQNNIIQDGSDCDTTGLSTTLSVAPLLEALANNGGSTQTHALQSTSPARDAGDCDVDGDGAADESYDQRDTGYDRVVNSACDIGAYEAQ